jgi:2Fe-2S ferredoxin
MPALTINPSGKVIDAAEGASILEALLAANISLATRCGGKAECGECHIFVHDGRKSITKTTREENARLDEIVGVGSKSRLACQARLGSEPVTIELLGFASGL